MDSPRESPWGLTQRDQKNGLEFDLDTYKKIQNYCANKNIEWSASAWDLDSQNFLRGFNLPFNKVASPMLGHFPLLNSIASEQKNLHFYRYEFYRRA